MTDWLSPDYWLSFISLPMWLGLAVAGVAAAWWFLGLRGAIAAAVGLLTFLAYRHGRDTQREELTEKIKGDQDKSEELIHDQERIARERGRAAAARVRAKGRPASPPDSKQPDSGA